MRQTIMNRKLWMAAAAVGAALAGAILSTAHAQDAAQVKCTRQYIVYFPAGSAEVTTDGKSVVQQAQQFAGPGASFVVVGHSDGAEQPVVSAQRANSLVAALTEAGIAKGRITSSAEGVAKLAVPAAGPEPLNRRGTICVANAS
jgi:outer membrane protein OmpA-like peptidoglycan-associated protein